MKHKQNDAPSSRADTASAERTGTSAAKSGAAARSREMIASATAETDKIDTPPSAGGKRRAATAEDLEREYQTDAKVEKATKPKKESAFKQKFNKVFAFVKKFDINEVWAGPKAWRGKRPGNYWVATTDFIRMISYFNTGGASASITYYLLLALFPLLAIIVGVIASLARNVTLSLSPDAVATIQKLIPDNIRETLGELIGNMTFSMSFATLSITVIVGLWAAGQGFGQIYNNVARIYPRRKGAITVPPRIVGFLYTIFFMLLLVVTTFVLSFGNVLFNFINNHFKLIQIPNTVINLLTYLLGFGLLLFMFFMLYYSAGKRSGQKLKSLPGALFTALGWILLTTFYSLYISNKASLSTIYGGFVNIIVLLIWLKMCSQIMLLGALVNYIATWHKYRLEYGASLMNVIEEHHLDTEPTDLFAPDPEKKRLTADTRYTK